MNDNTIFKTLRKIAIAGMLFCIWLCSTQALACYLCEHCSSYDVSYTSLTKADADSFSCSTKKCETSSGLGCNATCKAIKKCSGPGSDGLYTCSCSYVH